MNLPPAEDTVVGLSDQVNYPGAGFGRQETDEEILERYSFPKPPPAIDSPEEKRFKSALARRRLRNIEISRKTSDKDLAEVLKADPAVDAGERARLALEIHTQLRRNNRRKRLMFWSGWLFFILLLSGLSYLGWLYAMNHITHERYTVPYTCKIPYGNSELEGHRYLSFPVKSLEGWRWTPPWSEVDEKVEVVLKGDPIIFVGISNKGKKWRKEFTKGEFGTAKLPLSATYWIIGKNFKETTVIQHTEFCK